MRDLAADGDLAATFSAPVANFFVDGDTTTRGGVRVTALDADGDARADLVVGSGEGLTILFRRPDGNLGLIEPEA